ncbi:hypothetical protein DJ010_11185 [Nocardioides silvaticus]|uniref:Serine aminopeptidase S33 domain-containing protein n=1 Tax=Nocardioides silvaticus TaxID=2201891 RepID=A0A316THF2_9ACTN|nr:alpha/beta hydrolase [Nocardioides silvaticus]PWN02941.1 hypothetical protein DJ010_11185 [Nocardioides silvaticus]
MSGVSTEAAAAARPVSRTLWEHRDAVPETADAVDRLSPVSQAALRQLSPERMTAYGVDPADAIDLRGRVVEGEDWQATATELAERLLARAAVSGAAVPPTPVTRVGLLRRSSALLRMSQMMMLEDTDERREIYRRSAGLYAEAAALTGDRERVVLDSAAGTVVGWLIPAAQPVAAAIVIGGVEGWAFDFDSVGEALAVRGVSALMLDAPGQGETRFGHGTYLTSGWRAAYDSAATFLQRDGDLPLGLVGNSMGGSFVIAYAAGDPRVRACCDNGGAPQPWTVTPEYGTFFWKMAAACGTADADRAIATWRSVTPETRGPHRDYDLLVVHGARDPMVSQEMVDEIVADAAARRIDVHTFSDGVHCVYNHRADRDDLIADWMLAALQPAVG